MKRAIIIKTILKVIVVLGVILAFYGLWANYTWALERYYHANVSLMIQKNPSVSDVEILYNEEDDIFIPKDFEFRILISFNDGSTIELSGVNEYGKGDIRIIYVDDYYISFGNKNDEYADYTEEHKIWSAIIGTQIESIVDIIKNYHVITQYVKPLPDLHEHRNEVEIKLVNARLATPYEINVKVANRLLAEGALSFFTVGNAEYYACKMGTKLELQRGRR